MALSSVDLGGEETDRVRSASEVAFRCLALLVPVARSAGADKSMLLDWIAEAKLSDHLTEREKSFINGTLSDLEHERIQFTWMCERVTVLLWALQFLDALPPFNRKCDWEPLRALIPPFGNLFLSDFMSRAQLRTSAELYKTALEIQAAHGRGRSDRHDSSVSVPILQERHHAINWVVGYCGEDWECVTTDT